MKIKKELTLVKKLLLMKHKKKGTHSAKHMDNYEEKDASRVETFMEAHKIAMRQKGK